MGLHESTEAERISWEGYGSWMALGLQWKRKDSG